MKNEKYKNNRRQNIEINNDNQRNRNFTSPKKENKNLKPPENNKKVENLTENNILENTLNYIKMGNGNNNYIIPQSPTIDNNYIIQGLNEEYNLTKKYTTEDISTYDFYSQAERENGEEKLHKVKDEYIEYLQRQLEENNKNSVKLESKLTEIQKKFKNLIDDNRILSENLNERTAKLKESLQENENLRLQINNYIDNETKYKLQFEYYQKQIKMYETNINDYNNIINDLKISNEKLTNDLSQNSLNENLKTNNENNTKINTTGNTNNNYNNYNYFNVKNIHTGNSGELQLIKNQNMIYENDIKSKDYTIDLINKKNQKLLHENKIYKTQIKQYSQQILNLYNILRQKNKIIEVYKQQLGIVDNNFIDIEFEKKLEEFNLNFINNSELFADIANDDFSLQKMNILDYNSFTNFENNKIKEKIEQIMNQNFDNENKDININNNLLDKDNNKDKKSFGLIETKYLQMIKKDNNINNNNKININKDDKKEKEKETPVFINSRRKNNANNTIIVSSKNKKEEEKPKTVNIKVQSNNINKEQKKHISFKGLLDTKEEMKETAKEVGRKKNLSHVPKKKKKFRISDILDVTEINTHSPVAVQNLSFSKDDSELLESNDYLNTTSKKLYLFGINRQDFFFEFDLKEKKLSKKNILDIEDISDTFKQDYQYDGTILYNTLTGLFILTGKKPEILYYYNPKYDTLNKICKFNYEHDNGSLLLDKEYNRIFVFGGKNTKKCEFYSFNEKKVNSIPDLNIDRANGSFIICNDKIFGFFGFSYKNNKYCGNIEYIDIKKLDRWYEIKNLKILNDNINNKFDIESVSTINYKEDKNKILIYGGIQGDNEDFIIDYYYLYDTKDNSIDLVDKWTNRILKYVGSRWRNSNLTKKDPPGFHFAKNSNFLKLPQKAKIDEYDGEIYLMMDYKNNVHLIEKKKKYIDVYKSDL